MKERDEKGGGSRLPEKRPSRDDTPSIIREVERLTSIPARHSIANLPVLEMPKSQRIWRRIRIPLFVTIVIALLLTVALITRNIKVASSIANTIEEALELETKGTIEQTRLAEKMLAKLSEKHPGDDNAAAGWAWQTVLQDIMFGEPLSEEATEALEDIDDDAQTPYAFAARAGHVYLSKTAKEALEIAEAGLSRFPNDPRVSLVEILALNASGKKSDAWNRLLEVMEANKTYLPLITIGAVMALNNGDRLDALELAKMLLMASPGNLYAEMLIIHLGLPSWGEPSMESKQVEVLKKKYHAITPRMGAASPKLKTMGHYLRGRLLLVAGEPGEALVSFKKALSGKRSPEIIAWYAKAVRAHSDVTTALAVLDQYNGSAGPPTLDMKAQLLLEYHRVKQAKTVLDALRKSGALKHRLRELSWLYAIRSGDMKLAKETLPEKISGDRKWPALEMYFQLKHTGDVDGVDKLTKALDGEWGTCSRVIRSWHSRSLRRATRLFGNKRVACADHLMPRLMKGRLPAEMVAEAAEAVHEKSGASALFEVDRALAVWRVKGHAAGMKILDDVSALKPEGEPLIRHLAAAYVEMDRPEKALSLLGKGKTPELLALRILAHEAAKQKRRAEALVKQAVKESETSPHPVYLYFKLRKLYQDRKLELILKWMEEDFDKKLYGEWTSEIAEMCARAQMLSDLKVEAGEMLQRISKQLLVPSGADEAIDSWFVDVKLNVTKGGRHKNRAMVIIRTLREEGVKDPGFAYWLGVENITNGSERLGLKFIKEALSLDPAFKPAWAKMAEMEWMGEQTAARMRHMLPNYNPPGAPPLP